MSAFWGFTVMVVWIGGLIGWVANIVQLAGMVGDPITGAFVVKFAGVFVAPIGAVLGLAGMI